MTIEGTIAPTLPRLAYPMTVQRERTLELELSAEAVCAALRRHHRPALFLRVGPDGFVETRPIEGTRPRDGNDAQDHSGARELARVPGFDPQEAR